MVLDLRVTQRLGDGRVVDLAVPVAAIPDQIDDHIAMEGVAILRGQRGDAQHGVGVFGIHMKDGDGQAFGDIGRKARRVDFVMGRGKANQIVHNDVDRSANGESFNVGEVHRLGQYALPGKGRVAMNDNRNQLVFSALTQAHLLRAGAARQPPDRPPQDAKDSRPSAGRLFLPLRVSYSPVAPT